MVLQSQYCKRDPVLTLQTRLGRGEFNSDAIKVLHLSNNPEFKAQLEHLEARAAGLQVTLRSY